MLTGAPPSERASTTPPPRQRVWPWAAGSIFITLAVIVATLVGHRLAAQARLAAEVAPAPTLPPLAVEAIIHAPGAVSSLALDTHTHTLVAQIVPRMCPHVPIRCTYAPTSQTGVAFYDSATGALRSQTLTSADESPLALTDSTRGMTYLIGSDNVTVFSDATGKQTSAYSSQMGANEQAAAIDPRSGVIYILDGSSVLNAYNAADGQEIAKAPTTPQPFNILVDSDAQRIYTYAAGGDQPATLAAFNATDLSPLGLWHISEFTGGYLSAGPLNTRTHTLYFTAPDGYLMRLDLAGLPANGSGQTVNPQQLPSSVHADGLGVDGARALAVWSTTAADAGAEAIDSGTGQPYAALPLIRLGSEIQALATLPLDPSAQLGYVPSDDNTILIVSLAPPTSHTAPNALTAEVIARAAMAKLLPDTNQNPPFVAAQTFPVGAGTVTRQYFIDYSDLGWKGPYAGTASISAVKAGAEAGDYTMTFTITWNQLFLRQHSWSVEVTPDGRTHLLADSGDAIP